MTATVAMTEESAAMWYGDNDVVRGVVRVW